MWDIVFFINFLMFCIVKEKRSRGSICYTPSAKVRSTRTVRPSANCGSYEHRTSFSRLVKAVVQSRKTELSGNFIYSGKVTKIRPCSQIGTVGTIVIV